MRNVFEYYTEDDHLEHHGIKGQKWGVRRFQNPDGTLTEEGKRRYGEHGVDFLNAKQEKKEASKNFNKAFNKAYNKSYQAYSLSKKKRDASEKRWDEALDAAAKSRAADKKYKEAKKRMRDETGRSRSSKLKAQNYQKYSKNNLPIVSIGKHYSENAKYWKSAIKNIREMDSGKGKAFINTFLDQPIHVSGLTGTADTTLRKRYTGKFTEWY